MNELMEQMADLEHVRWSCWMKYQFGKCTVSKDVGVVIPFKSFHHWNRQLRTSYFDLSDREQESDRKEVRQTLALMNKFSDEEILQLVRKGG